MRPPNPKWLGFLTPFEPGIVDLAIGLREIVIDEAPEAVELPYDVKYAVTLAFTMTGRFKNAFCYIVAYNGHVNLGFPKGAELPDKKKLLEGDGKGHRHIKIKKPADLNKPYLRTFLRAAFLNAAMEITTEPPSRP